MQVDVINPDDRDFIPALASVMEVILAFDEPFPRMPLAGEKA